MGLRGEALRLNRERRALRAGRRMRGECVQCATKIVEFDKHGTPKAKCPKCRGRARLSMAVARGTAAKLCFDDLAVDTSGERCRCGLRLPCHSCLPLSAAELPTGLGQWQTNDTSQAVKASRKGVPV